MFLSLGLSFLLSFSYKIIEILFRSFRSHKLRQYSLYFWGVGILIAVPFFKENNVYSSPVDLSAVLPVFAILLVGNYVLSRYSGYHPIGRYNIINFAITYPIIEEVLFRGLILPFLNQSIHSAKIMEVMFLPVTIPVVISALLFAISHLQYYKLSSQSIRYMMFAFIGGIFFGAITDVTHSILLSCLLHIEFNVLSIYFAKRSSINRT
ncbi:CPBP family intramembrane glutamic endopeptidase [Paenibacillus ihbetae]|uniref:CAAX protease n=1 Tax=Paenibacillus ihbetae TaxID=1870820 RepID=A0ABX3JY04_9BACL|nr:CPBP family intramembrane glutamic endopeptidase [Paenibacillus ihbetae]OOC62562.1 CAAX protease [Paenibacillus ihbetae]